MAVRAQRNGIDAGGTVRGGGGAGPARSRRRRSGKSWLKRGSPARLGRIGRRTLSTMLPSPGLATVALVLFFLIFSVDFLILLHPFDSLQSLVFEESGAGYTDTRVDAAGSIKRDAGLLVYALGLLMLAVHRGAVRQFFVRHPHWLVLFAVVLLGTLWSIDPLEVLNNVVQLVVGLVLAIAYASTRSPGLRGLRAFCALLVLTLGALHFSSLVLFVTQVDGPMDFFLGLKRYGGIFGNPNTSAGNAVLGIWASMTLLFAGSAPKPWRWCARGTLLLCVFSVAVSGSATSTVAGAGVVGLVVWIAVMRKLSRNQRVIGNLMGIFAVLLAGGALLIGSATNDVTGEVAGSLGKDSTFTGRTELWTMARRAIAEKPVLGWSLDSHESVFARHEFEIPYNHYHNGYLDLLVNGGFLLALLVLYDLGWFAFLWRRVVARNATAMLAGVPLFMVFALNLTEYSLLRPVNPIWQVYICTFCLLSVAFRDVERDARPGASDGLAYGRSRISSGLRKRFGKRFSF